ncbi:hypothetical protein FB451DRAFT_1264895 [Mycena latifolia]|nr:hypothetical protein FB451DRAFT_1264895 [Mycena latifolia]
MGEFDLTIGVTLMGVMINTYLTGVIMSQFLTYLNSSASMVAFLFIINITQAAAVVYDLVRRKCMVSRRNFTNPSVVAIGIWSYPFTAFVTAVLANKNLVGFLVVTALATCGMGIAAGIQALILSELAKLIALQPVVEANLAPQCALDVIIAIVLTIIFSRSKTSFGRTDEVLNHLIRTAIQFGFFTAVFALGSLLSFRFSPGTFMIELFSIPIGRIYTHTMMDYLITHEQLRNLLTKSGNTGNMVSFPQFAGGGETIMI